MSLLMRYEWNFDLLIIIRKEEVSLLFIKNVSGDIHFHFICVLIMIIFFQFVCVAKLLSSSSNKFMSDERKYFCLFDLK